MEKPSRPVTIIVVDNQQLVRESLSALIDSDPTVRLVASVANCEAAIALLADAPPAVALVDSELGGSGTFASIRKLRSTWSAMRVVLLLTSLRDGVIEQARSLGVEGIVTRMEPFEELRRTIEAVTIGRCSYSPRVQARFVSSRGTGKPSSAVAGRPPHITPREFDVLRCLVGGRTVKQAASDLGLASPTVDNHKTRLMSRLDVHTGPQLVRYAIREGIIDA